MQLLYVLLSLAAILALLVCNEFFWRKKNAHQEVPRKIVHIVVGSFVAFWPFFMSWTDIRVITLALVVGIVLSKTFKVFASIHEVDRLSVGEISFALAVGLLTFITKSRWIYAAALLEMGLADGLAAIIGVHFGKRNSYKVLGYKKSLAGSLTFFLSSLAIIFSANTLAHAGIAWYQIVILSLTATLIENLAIWGLDNLLLPVVVALLLIRV